MPLSGLLFINKPSGPTSHDIVNIARKKLGIKTIGHTGTLDPFATGLLILLVGKPATKQQQKFLKMDKIYLATAIFGYTSNTYDIAGDINAKLKVQSSKLRSLQHINNINSQNNQTPYPSLLEIKKTLTVFQGDIVQTVPPFSAIKRKGKKLYQLARQGKINQQDLPQRQVIIHKFEITPKTPPLNLYIDHFIKNNNLTIQQFNNLTMNFQISCSSGTYIRSLIHDLGQELGCGHVKRGCGALVAALHRTHIGPYSIKNSILPHQIDFKYLHPLSSS